MRKTTKVYNVLCLKSSAALEQENLRDEGSVPSSRSDGSYHNSGPVEGDRRDLVPLVSMCSSRWELGGAHLEIRSSSQNNTGGKTEAE